MLFWPYILRCSDASYYVGHTDDLETRFEEHRLGRVNAYMRKRRPVKLVFAQAFATRVDALEREREIRGLVKGEKGGADQGQLGASSGVVLALVSRERSSTSASIRQPTLA